MFKPRIIFFLLAIVCIFPSALSAKEWRLSASDEPESLQSVIQAAQAGDTISINGGIFHGPITTDKPIHLIGLNRPAIDGGRKGTVLVLKGRGSSVEGFIIRGSGDILSQDHAGLLAEAPEIRIENNIFEDVLFGIDLKLAPRSIIRGNILKGKALDLARRGDLIRIWYSDDVLIENNRTESGRDVVLWFSKNLIVRHNTFVNARYGLHFMYCSQSIVQDNLLHHNSVGIYLMYSRDIQLVQNRILHNRGPSGFGVGFKDMENSLVKDNIIANNRVAFFLDHGSGTYQGNLIGVNDVGIQMLPSAKHNYFNQNSFIDNGEQVVIDGGSSIAANEWVKNFWSDYRGYDRDRDGIGDIPYHTYRFFERLTDRYSTLKFFALNPSVQALDFAANTFPIFSPEPKLTDQNPLMALPLTSFQASRPAQNFYLTLASLVLLSLFGFFNSTPILLPLSQRKTSVRMFHFGSKIESHAVIPAFPIQSPAIHIRGLNKNFGKVEVLHDINFDIKTGETVVLWGPNGAGKTTVLRCLLGSLPSEGNITILGEDLKKNGKKVRAQIGYVPQEIRLHIEQTVDETVSFYAALRRVTPARVNELLKTWGLNELRKRYVNHLSGGMKQKLALVIALLSDPPILFLDESTSNLDLRVRHEFMSFLSQIKKSGKTILLCSHHVTEVWKLADRVVALQNGRKIEEGSPEALRHLLGGERLLFITVPERDLERSCEVLSQRGFSAARNELSLILHVPEEKKAEPFYILKNAGIQILDFELEREETNRLIPGGTK